MLKMRERCGPEMRLLDARLLAAPQQRQAGSNSTSRTIVSHGYASGLGDQTMGFLGALALALATGRRLELGTERGALLGPAFDSRFDLGYTGEPAWAAAADTAIDLLNERRRNCSSSCPECCAVRSHALTRPLDVGYNPLVGRSVPASTWRRVGLTVGYGKAHEMEGLVAHRGVTFGGQRLRQQVEFVAAGNAGSRMFRAYFLRALAEFNGSFTADSAACVLRHVLRPSAAAQRAVERHRPRFWGAHREAGGGPRIAIHVRASGVLLTRLKVYRYSAADAMDSALGCEGGEADVRRVWGPRNASAPRSAAGLLSEVVSNRSALGSFEQFWLAGRLAEAAVLAARRPESGTGDGSASAAPNSPNASDARWLLASDTAELKASARRAWGPLKGTTDIEPSHTRCGGDAFALERRLETVAEALLLAEADALVHGDSSFSSVVALLCVRCVQTFSVGHGVRDWPVPEMVDGRRRRTHGF